MAIEEGVENKMSKDYETIDGIKKNIMYNLDTIFDKGYDQGFKDGSKDKAAYCELNYNHGVNKGYEAGLKDAWNAARKIAEREDDMRNCFHDISPAEIFGKYSALECMTKIKEYEENQKANDEIRVGDEVDHDGLKSVVVKVWQDCVCTISQVGTTPSYTDKSVLKKTGKHFDEIEELLKQLQGE